MIKYNFYTTQGASIFTKGILNIFILSFYLTHTLYSQGPLDGYSKGKGNFTTGLSYSFEKNNQFFAGNTEVSLPRTIQSLSLFAIYGISERLDAQISVPYINMNNGAEKNLQDFAAYLKYNFLKKDKFKLFLGVGGYTPLSNYQTEGGNAIGQLNQALDIRIIGQYQLKNNYFLSSQAGFFTKTNPTPHAFSGSLKFGYATGKLYYDVWYEYYASLGGTDYRGTGELDPTTMGGFKSIGFGYHKVGGTIFKPINNSFGIFIGGGYTPFGRNIGKSYRVSAGVNFNIYK